MARRGKNGSANGQIDSEPAEAPNGNAERLDMLPDIARKIESAKQRSDDARSDLGNIYQDAEERGFNRRALKEAVRLRNMEHDKRRDYLTNLNAYCDKLGVWDQGELLDEQPRPPQPIDQPAAPTEAELHERSDAANQDVAGYTHEVGRQAGLAGKSASNNPWPDGVKAHETWHKGWLAGQEELVNSTVGKGQGKRRGRKPKDDGGAEAPVH